MIGGVLAFGLLGVFIGPILLAVVFTLIKEWGAAQAQKALQPVADANNER